MFYKCGISILLVCYKCVISVISYKCAIGDYKCVIAVLLVVISVL